MTEKDRKLTEDLNPAPGTPTNVVPYLHLYAQDYSHSEAYIVGNTCALRGLRDAINKVIERGEADKAVAYASDGEGYNVLIVPVNDSEFESTLLPYIEGYGDDITPGPGKHPFAFLKSEAYRKLME